MAVKVKTTKPEAQKVPFGVCLALQTLVPKLACASYEKWQKVDAIMKQLNDGISKAVSKAQKEFNDLHKNELTEGEELTPVHPLNRVFNESLYKAETGLRHSDLSVYTENELFMDIEGVQLNYSDRAVLQYWLIKPKKAD